MKSRGKFQPLRTILRLIAVRQENTIRPSLFVGALQNPAGPPPPFTFFRLSALFFAFHLSQVDLANWSRFSGTPLKWLHPPLSFPPPLFSFFYPCGQEAGFIGTLPRDKGREREGGTVGWGIGGLERAAEGRGGGTKNQ